MAVIGSTQTSPLPASGKVAAEKPAYEATLFFSDIFEEEKRFLDEAEAARVAAGSIASADKPKAAEAAAATASAEPSSEKSGQPRSYIGLCLSGGGIRSAAFSLGVLQALSARHVFPRLDYLSTVSGGGFTGAALVAGLKRNNGEFPFGGAAGPGQAAGVNEYADNDAVRGLRDRCRYLMPNSKFDLIVSLGILLRGLSVNAVIVAAALFVAATLTLVLYPTEAALESHWLLRTGIPWGDRIQAYFGTQMILTRLGAIALSFWLVIWALGLSLRRSSRFRKDPDSHFARGTAYVLILFAAVVITDLQQPILARIAAWKGETGPLFSWLSFGTFLTTLFTGSGLIAVFWRRIVSFAQSVASSDTWAGLFKRIWSRIQLFVLAMVLPLLIYIAYLWLVILGLKTPPGSMVFDLPRLTPLSGGDLAVYVILLSAAVILSSVLWSAKIGPISETLFSGSWWRSPESRSIWVRTIVVLACSVAIFAACYRMGSVLVGYIAIIQAETESTAAAYVAAYQATLQYGAFAVFLSMLAGRFTENANSLHRLYRDRLANAFFLGGDDGKPAYLFSDLSSLKSKDLPLRPYLIVNAAANIQKSRSNKRGRNADFFTVTPHYVGSDLTKYVKTKTYEAAEPHLDLAAATAISGAAVSSAMGRVGVAVLAPTLALLNLRLAYWVRNPRLLRQDGRNHSAAVRDWKISYLFCEMFGWLHEGMSKINLSDGGHIDNLGLYQLLKRRCDVIFVSDAESDPGMTFASFVDVQRFARIDLGIRLEVPVADIREAALKRQAKLNKEGALSVRSPDKAHVAIGRVYYPETQYGTGPTLSEKEGILVYVKSCVTGDESDYVLDYEKRYRRFPHEATSDQFFSEEQFEAYRALGFHATSHGLDAACRNISDPVLRAKLRAFLGP